MKTRRKISQPLVFVPSHNRIGHHPNYDAQDEDAKNKSFQLYSNRKNFLRIKLNFFEHITFIKIQGGKAATKLILYQSFPFLHHSPALHYQISTEFYNRPYIFFRFFPPFGQQSLYKFRKKNFDFYQISVTRFVGLRDIPLKSPRNNSNEKMRKEVTVKL